MRLYGICGDSGQGKTRLVSRVLAEAQRLGWRCRGVFSPAVFEDGLKIGIGVKLLPGMQTRVLARLATAEDTRYLVNGNLTLRALPGLARTCWIYSRQICGLLMRLDPWKSSTGRVGLIFCH